MLYSRWETQDKVSGPDGQATKSLYPRPDVPVNKLWQEGDALLALCASILARMQEEGVTFDESRLLDLGCSSVDVRALRTSIDDDYHALVGGILFRGINNMTLPEFRTRLHSSLVRAYTGVQSAIPQTENGQYLCRTTWVPPVMDKYGSYNATGLADIYRNLEDRLTRGCIREVNIKEAHQYVALMRSMEKLAYAHLPDNCDDGYFAKRMADVVSAHRTRGGPTLASALASALSAAV
jgi:hypothetical protein